MLCNDENVQKPGRAAQGLHAYVYNRSRNLRLTIAVKRYDCYEHTWLMTGFNMLRRLTEMYCHRFENNQLVRSPPIQRAVEFPQGTFTETAREVRETIRK